MKENNDEGSKIKKAVILIGSEDLLGRVMEHFLNSREEWNVIKVTHIHSASQFKEEAAKAKPDVVVIYQDLCTEDANLLIQLMKEYPKLKIVVVNHHDNSIEVYKKQKVWLREISDLLEAVES